VRWRDLFTFQELGCLAAAIGLIVLWMLMLMWAFSGCTQIVMPMRVRVKASMNPRVEMEISRGETAVRQPPSKFEEIDK
jgi:hypothetical protein